MKKKVSFMDVIKSELPEENKDKVDLGRSKVAFFIPILTLENMLDVCDWSTSNFNYTIFKDGYANLAVAASLELSISYLNDEQILIKRTFVGACNFSLSSIEPNTHFLATAKSECIKNAASDIGRYFGRGMNNDIVPSQDKVGKVAIKSKPDSKIMSQFLKAVEENDEAAISMLSNIYDIKTNEHDNNI